MLEELGYDDLDCCSLRARCHPGEPGFDPLLFKIYGYGGYGYDIGSWDDLKQDSDTPRLVKAAGAGDLTKVVNSVYHTMKGLLERFGLQEDREMWSYPQILNHYLLHAKNPAKWPCHLLDPMNQRTESIRRLLNASKRWTEVIYQESGFVKVN